MGLLRKWVLGRWFVRWLLRGSPGTVAAKLAAVALWGAWKWRREKRRAETARRELEIPADYEVVGRDRLAAAEPGSSERGTEPTAGEHEIER